MSKTGIQKIVHINGVEMKDIKSWDSSGERTSTAEHTINREGVPQGTQEGSFNGTWSATLFVHEGEPEFDFHDYCFTLPKKEFSVVEEEGTRRKQLQQCKVNTVGDATTDEDNRTVRTAEGIYLRPPVYV